MKLAARFAFLLTVFALCLGVAHGQFGGRVRLVPTLVGDTSGIAAGQPFTVGVLMKMQPGWHTYWQNPGESGMPPQIQWTLPDGFKAGEIQWPIPVGHNDGDFLTYVYENEVLLPVQITPPANLPAGEVTLKAKVNWLVCEKICVPGNAEVALKLPVGQAAPANAELFATWRARLPKTTPSPAVKWNTSDPKNLVIDVLKLGAGETAELFPLPPNGAKTGQPKLAEPDADVALRATFPVDPVAPAGAVWRALLVVKKGETRDGWYVASDAPPVVAAVAPPEPAPTVDANPPTPASNPPAIPPDTARTVSEPPVTVPPVAAVSAAPAVAPEVPPAAEPKRVTLASALFLAFVGGLVLNVMPCVLPVIALKIFGFVKQAGQDPRRVFRLGLAFVAGVFVFFLSLAAIAVALHASGRSLSWGAQFQNPYLLAGIIALIFVFGLNLLGVFEITLSGGATSTLSELSSREGYGGAFLHGLFTTLLGTSCTAPFLAVSLGYAVTQPAAIIFLLFATVALGMSLPYFLLTAVPSWMKYLPKPGVWMERFKQITGFIMMAVVVWLFSVMAGSRQEAATHLSWYLLALGIACWAMGAYRQAVVRWLVFPLVVVGGYFGILHGALAEATQGAGSNLTARIETARQTGQPVFVDFTADWCVNCKAFEKAVLKTEKVQAAFNANKVVTVVADWTNPDAEIEQWLAKFNRAGVPMYLLYRPGQKEPVVMDSLTSAGLLAELGK